MYELLPNKTWDDKKTLELFTGIVAKLKDTCNNDVQRISELIDYLGKNDSRRNLNWRQVFDDLYNLEKNNYVVQ